MPNFRSGFSMIQLVVVLALITTASLIVAPNLFRRVPLYERKAFVEMLNTVARQSWIRALQTGNVHKVIFNISQRSIRLEEKKEGLDRDGKPIFEPLSLGVIPERYQWPEQFEIKQFFIQGVDEIANHAAGRTMQDVWFFIIPEGMAQEVIINLVDRKDTHYAYDGQEISLALNPFRVQFNVYEEFQNPATI